MAKREFTKAEDFIWHEILAGTSDKYISYDGESPYDFWMKHLQRMLRTFYFEGIRSGLYLSAKIDKDMINEILNMGDFRELEQKNEQRFEDELEN